MFKKLFAQKAVPKSSGTPVPKVDRSRWIKSFEVELSNMQHAPTYQLTHQLSIGRELGNIVVDDPSISPRHATLMLQEEVVSIIDHASISGTFVNGKKIAPGKNIILEESDVIRVGDLDIKVLVKTQRINEDEVPPMPSDDVPPLPVKEKASVINSKPIEQEPVVRKKPEMAIVNKPKAKTKNAFAIKNYHAANAVVRVAAVVGDFILAYIVLTLMMPFDEFRQVLDFIPSLIADLLGIEWMTFWNEIKNEYGAPAEMLADVAGFLSASFDFLPMLLAFGLIRLISTFLFGVSISELMLGMRGGMNGMWKRFGGVIRVLIGFVTFPFLVFDAPAIISRRTLKEVITHTHVYIGSRLFSFLGTIVYIPLLLALSLIAPLFQGLELPISIPVNSKIDQRVKVAQAPTAATGDPAVDSVVASNIKSTSNYLGVELNYSPEEVTVLPNFNFVGERNKLKLQGKITLILKQQEDWSVEIELLKSFDMQQLLGIGLKGNFFVFDRYPQIHEFVHSSSVKGPGFRQNKDELTNEAFAREFIDLTKTSFELNQDNLLSMMQTRSPLIKGFVDFKSSLLALIEYKDFSDLGFIKIGNATFMRLSYVKQRPFDLLIPLVKGEGKIYKVTYDKDRQAQNATLANMLYKFALYEANWMPRKRMQSGEVMTPLEVLDTFTIDYQQAGLSLEKAQSLYGYYFEKSAEILRGNSLVEYNTWLDSVSAVLQIVEAIKPVQVEEGAENPRDKLIQNFRDLKNALENKNLEYFGVPSSTNV